MRLLGFEHVDLHPGESREVTLTGTVFDSWLEQAGRHDRQGDRAAKRTRARDLAVR
jgi:hypothetical protein